MDEAVLVLRRERWNEALHVQADAFSEDQLIGHWAIGGRDQRERERRVRRLFELFKGTASFEHAEIHMLGDASASAIWLRPPGHFRQPLTEQLRLLLPMLALLGGRTARTLGLLTAMEKQHPTARDHWYLLGIAVRRDQQGRGAGAAVALRPRPRRLGGVTGIPGGVQPAQRPPLRVARLSGTAGTRPAERRAGRHGDVAGARLQLDGCEEAPRHESPRLLNPIRDLLALPRLDFLVHVPMGYANLGSTVSTSPRRGWAAIWAAIEMNGCGRVRTAVDTNSLKRGRNGRLRTAVDYSRCPFKEEVMGSNPIRATDAMSTR